MNIFEDLQKEINDEFNIRCENSLKHQRQRNPNATLSEDLKKRIYAGAEDEITYKFLDKLDYKNPEVRNQTVGLVKEIFNQILQDKPIKKAQFIALHHVIAKLTLMDLGLENEKIFYSSGKSRFIAERNSQTKTINFYYINLFQDDILYPVKYNPPDKDLSIKHRLVEIATKIYIMQHEIEHTFQEKENTEVKQDIQKLTPTSYLILMQDLARKFSYDPASKYFNKESNDADRLYHDNHDQFYMELDADKVGIERTFKLLKNLCPKAYAAVKDTSVSAFTSFYNSIKQRIDSYQDLTWVSFNENEQKTLSACHTTGLIIDDMIKKLSEGKRAEVFKNYPALILTYRQDGAKKSLEEIENESAVNIRNIKRNIPGINGQIRARKIEELYEIAIMSDATLIKQKQAIIDKKQAKIDAERVLCTVFPNFQINPINYIGILNGAMVQETNNIDEKMELIESFKQYRNMFAKLSPEEKIKYPSPISVLNSIHLVYDFRIPEDKKAEFDEKLLNNEIPLIDSILTNKESCFDSSN